MPDAHGPSRRIVTERLVLEPLTIDLARAIVAGDLSGLRPGPGWPHADTLDGVRMDLEHGDDDRCGWLVTFGDDGTVIGDCGWRGGPDACGDAEIGYGLAPRFRGRGYGTEAVRGLVQWAMDQPGVRRVTAEVSADNLPSRRILSRLGFGVDAVEGATVRLSLGRRDSERGRHPRIDGSPPPS